MTNTEYVWTWDRLMEQTELLYWRHEFDDGEICWLEMPIYSDIDTSKPPYIFGVN